MPEPLQSPDSVEPVIRHLGVLLVDLQPPFLQSLGEARARSLLQRCRFVAEVATCFGLPLVVTEQHPEKLGDTAPELLNVLPNGTPRFPKTAFSALGDGTLDHWLEEHAVDHLLIAGMETAICVYASAVDAVGRELGVTVLSDAVGGRQESETPQVFAALRHLGAHVLPAETVFYSLLGSARHHLFRPFTQLVKAYTAP